jgi:hypothetical protein
MSLQLVALLFSPIATEMQVTVNAIIWLRQAKERMALTNISGAMTIRATVPTAGVVSIAVTALFLMFRGGRMSVLTWAARPPAPQISHDRFHHEIVIRSRRSRVINDV